LSESGAVIVGSEVVTAGLMVLKSDVLASASAVEVVTSTVISAVSSGLDSEATLEALLEVISVSKLDASVVCESTSEETDVMSELVSGDGSVSVSISVPVSVSVETVPEVASVVGSPVIPVVLSPIVVPSAWSVAVASTSSWVTGGTSEVSLSSVEAGRDSLVTESSKLVVTSVEAVASVSSEDVADVSSLWSSEEMWVDDSKELGSEMPSVGGDGSEEVSGRSVLSPEALEVASDDLSGVTADSTAELGW
jgi:hypothetical protein